MIEFTKEEEAICQLLKDHAASLDPPATPRLAGGFVRDKILGIACHDMDVALDNISGIAFATGLAERLKDRPSVHAIMPNPEKSKHLETAVLNLGHYSIDFVHLRSEAYAESRIPAIECGTPEQDAFRRDITVNTLFYNLITGEIEDFTGRGLKDMENRVIDTPLNPKTTLMDDPLRILRIFRFKTKLGFNINERIYSALQEKCIGKALKEKVSNERNGIEIMKMLGYQNGEVGLIEIVFNNLVDPVFKPGVPVEVDVNEAIKYVKDLNNILDALLIEDYLKLNGANIFLTVHHRSILKLYTVLQYFVNIKIGKEKKGEFVNVRIVRDSLKTSRELFCTVKKIEEGISDTLAVEFPDIVEFVLRWKEHWLVILIILFLKFKQEKYYQMVKNIFDLKYQDCYLQAPIVNGDFLQEHNTAVKDFKQILFDCLVYQVKNSETDRDKIYENVLKTIKNSLTIVNTGNM